MVSFLNLPSRRTLILGGAFIICLGVLGTIALISHFSHTIQAQPTIRCNAMDPPRDDGSVLSQADIAEIKSGLEMRLHDPTESTWYYSHSWLDAYRYTYRSGDGQVEWQIGTCDYVPYGTNIDPPCHSIIWLKGRYGLYFYDSHTPDPVWQKAHPNATRYVELRKAEDSGITSHIIFVVPAS